MIRKYFYLAAVASTMLASCTSDEFTGPQEVKDVIGQAPIAIGGGTGNMTRSTADEVTKLQGQFKIYGVKSGTTAGSDLQKVFADYIVWNNDAKTASNPDGTWEYVGNQKNEGTNIKYGKGNIELTQDQTIKYWDYSAADYRFVAGSPASAFTYTIDSDNNITSAAVTGLGGHISANTSGTAISTTPVYIAEPKIVLKSSYQSDVTFSFALLQSFVRVGIYETIPGYSISSISFYPYDESDWGTTSSSNIILASNTANYFVGGTATGTVNYSWTPTPSYTLSYNSGLNQAKNWYGGALSSGVQAISSTETDVAKLYGTDSDMADTGYFTVIPTPSGTTAAPILIKCDYTLTSTDDSGETINVKGATAAIPAAFSKWAPNTSYTYLFKISENTNGTTGTPDTDPAGLFPITFDAVVTATTDGSSQGTTTIVNTPSITTYQSGSVSGNTIKYVTSKAIEVTVCDASGTVLAISNTTAGVGYTRVFKLSAAKTEADLQVTAPSDSEKVTSEITDNKLTFTPDAAGYYAVQYQTAASPAAYTYKVIHVEE